jgi:hypothetical protein
MAGVHGGESCLPHGIQEAKSKEEGRPLLDHTLNGPTSFQKIPSPPNSATVRGQGPWAFEL